MQHLHKAAAAHRHSFLLPPRAVQALSQQNGRLMTHLGALDHQRGILMNQVLQAGRGRARGLLRGSASSLQSCPSQS